MNKFLPLLLAMVVVGCKTAASSPSQFRHVKYGRYHGFCGGYCAFELTLKEGSAECRWTSHSGSNPDIQKEFDFSNAEWMKLTKLVDYALLKTLEDRIGCPDCADEGAEWIEIKPSLFESKKVIFSDGQTPERITALTNAMRAFSKKCPPHPAIGGPRGQAN